MAKQRRSPTRAASKPGAKAKRVATAKTVAKRKPPTQRARKAVPAPVTKIRAEYTRAVGIYQKGLKALQRRNYETAATAFRQVLEQFPEERELHERAQLYVNVCERESGSTAKAPRTVDERVLAATLAVNRRDPDEALALLRNAASSHPSDDRLHYLLALAHALRDDADTAAKHLAKAIALNPDNRVQARREPDFDAVRTTKPFRDAMYTI